MDASIESEDGIVEVVTPSKKKKLKQARLPFQTLSVSKSPNSTNNMPNKKRKVTSPLEELKSNKIIKFTKENSVKDIAEEKEEAKEKLDTSIECIELETDQEEEDLKQNNEQECVKGEEINTTPKRSSLKKSKTMEKSQKKSGALTKFLTKLDNQSTSSLIDDSSLNELDNEKDCQNTSAYEEETGLPSHCTSSGSEEIESIQNIEKPSISQDSDSDTAILSSDTEAQNELDKSKASISEEKVATIATPITPKNDKEAMSKLKKLTPKQLEKKQEMAKKKEEKAKLRMEREKKLLEEKANRRKKREEKQKKKEEKEKLEKEQKKKERELKELRKQMEIEQKQKEKEAKEEERRKREEAKEEEKRKKEEEKLEAERKKQKAASNFASFFVSKKQEAKSAEEENVVEAKNFMPFEVKVDMRIAPVCRRILSQHEKLLLEEKCNAKDTHKSELYLADVKNGRIVPRISSRTWRLETKDDDIIILDEDNDGNSNIIQETRHLETHRPKLLQFGDNRRPPYWGTWRKRSSVINSRRPFVKDQKWFDYEVDSDDEWEEEEPGESLKGSDDEKDDEKDEENLEDNEYDVDNEFMVPHGYLSDEEARADEEEMEDMSPQTQKMKLKLLGEQFEAERKEKTHKLQPKIIGCVWQGPSNALPDSAPTKLREFVSTRQIWVTHIPIILPSSMSTDSNTTTNECKTPSQQPSGRSAKKSKADEAPPNQFSGELMRNWLGFRSETRVSD